PIIFATYPLLAGIDHASMFFNIVFFITILSLLLQGTTVAWFAKILGLIDKDVKKSVFNFDLPDEIRSEMGEVEITPEMLTNGCRLIDLALPEHSLVVLIKRNESFFIPRGSTTLVGGDILLIISDDKSSMEEMKARIGITT
ncbi:MAG: TrkA C-terminal domain-containing protein, partial [Bacteroidales bacterium]